jgi:hypothetical protein
MGVMFRDGNCIINWISQKAILTDLTNLPAGWTGAGAQL